MEHKIRKIIYGDEVGVKIKKIVPQYKKKIGPINVFVQPASDK